MQRGLGTKPLAALDRESRTGAVAIRPIFIHSLFRCASTYFFQKFRALGPALTCYQEPFNEGLDALNRPSRHGRLLAPANDPLLRHPQLDHPYFYEFWQRREALQGLYRRAFAYEEYFTGPSLPERQRLWIRALLQHSSGRPLLQFCRSSGRAGALRSGFDAIHLHLWREPRAQWWSYKVGDYFDSVSQRIYAGRKLPEALARLAGRITAYHLAPYPLPPQDNYALFYGLWLDAWLRLRPLADMSIGIDRIAVSAEDNRLCSARLSALVDESIHLSDIRPSGMVFCAEEHEFYESVEAKVADLFIASAHASAAHVASAERAASDARAIHARRAHDASAERNLRLMGLSMMRRRAGDSPGERGRAGTTPRWRWIHRLRRPRQPDQVSDEGATGNADGARGAAALIPTLASQAARDG
jgi:hypothetical protein